MITLTVMKIYFSKSYQNFTAGFVPCIGFVAFMQSCFGFIDANGCFCYFILKNSKYI